MIDVFLRLLLPFIDLFIWIKSYLAFHHLIYERCFWSSFPFPYFNRYTLRLLSLPEYCFLLNVYSIAFSFPWVCSILTFVCSSYDSFNLSIPYSIFYPWDSQGYSSGLHFKGSDFTLSVLRTEQVFDAYSGPDKSSLRVAFVVKMFTFYNIENLYCLRYSTFYVRHTFSITCNLVS